MTTKLHTAVDVEPSGLILVCAWCCTRPQLVALNRAYPGIVSHALCPACEARMNAEAA